MEAPDDISPQETEKPTRDFLEEFFNENKQVIQALRSRANFIEAGGNNGPQLDMINEFLIDYRVEHPGVLISLGSLVQIGDTTTWDSHRPKPETEYLAEKLIRANDFVLQQKEANSLFYCVELTDGPSSAYFDSKSDPEKKEFIINYVERKRHEAEKAADGPNKIRIAPDTPPNVYGAFFRPEGSNYKITNLVKVPTSKT